MTRAFKRITIAAAIAAVSLSVLSLVAFAAGARINDTKSIPLGLYWLTNDPIEKGAYVLFCPPQAPIFEEAKHRGYIGSGVCPGGFGYMMKRVLAAKNDTVSITDEGVCVNGERLPLSTPVEADKAGRPLHRFQTAYFTVADSDLLLMSDVSAKSFDSRYFGPINRSQIKGVIRPVLTW